MYNSELSLFQRSSESIWTDEHISKSLLDAHLDETNDAASRKPENRIKIINWINERIKPNSKIIDLGCGPGLYSYELGKLGHNVLGIDFNIASYNYAKDNKSIQNKDEYRHCNYIKDTITGKYNVAMIIYCDFSALIPDDQKLLLQKITTLLEDDGIFVFDIFGKSALETIQEGRNWYISEGNDFWSKDPYILMSETKIFRNENAVGTRYYLIDQKGGKITEFIQWDQYYDENSIRQFLLENGFDIIEITKDLINYNEETFLVMAKKKK
jgi:SAM-dependent methyltransferase